MGKTARNEQIKLTAAFYNNISVGLIVAGAIVPYLAIYHPIMDFIFARIVQGDNHAALKIDVAAWIPTVGVLCVAIAMAAMARTIANLEIKKIKG